MSYFLYNAAPGPMYFLGSEIKAEPGFWTEVSEYSVNHGTFNSMRRMKMVYLVEADHKPKYDPTHPDNKAKVEASAPGAAADKKDKLNDGSMSADELQAFLAEKNGVGKAVSKVRVSDLSSKTLAITADNLAEIGLPPATFDPGLEEVISGPTEATADETTSGIQFEELGETVPFVKQAGAESKPVKAKAGKKAAVAEAVTPPENLGAWS